MTMNAGDKVKFWRNKRPVTHSDFQNGVVVAVGPADIKPAEGDTGLAVTLASGEAWLRVRNAANGKEFFVVAKPSDGPEPGCFTAEKPTAPVAPVAAPAPAPAPEPVRATRSTRVTTES